MNGRKIPKGFGRHWWAWATISVLFLIAMQILFSIPAPHKWLEAVWAAGDFVSFCGTVTLGFVAWAQSKAANDVSEKLIELQTAEYLPILTLTKFAGVSKFGSDAFSDRIEDGIFLAQMETKDNRIILDYALFLIDRDFCRDMPPFFRTYEVGFKYLGKPVIADVTISAIRFQGNGLEEVFPVGQEIGVSLVNEASFTFWIHLVSNHSVMEDKSRMSWMVRCRYFSIEIVLRTLTGSEFRQTITIAKQFVADADEVLDVADTERLVSTSYRLGEHHIESV